jgi:hypothetical protein
MLIEVSSYWIEIIIWVKTCFFEKIFGTNLDARNHQLDTRLSI